MIKYNRLAYSYCVKHTVGIIRLNKKAPAPSGRFVDIVQDDHSSQIHSEFHSVTRRRARRAVVARAAALLGVEVLLGKQELLVVHPLLVLVLVLILV